MNTSNATKKALLIAVVLSICACSTSSGRFATTGSNSETAAERDQRMHWWREARFGMFIHWGLYAVPAGEYNGQRSKNIGEWIMEWGNIPRAEYEKFAPRFNPV